MKTPELIHIGSRKVIPPDEILYLQSDVNYTKVFLVNGNMIYSSTTLKVIEDRIGNSSLFLRINKGIVINRLHMKTYQQGNVELLNNLNFPVSRRRKSFFNNTLIENFL